MMKKSETKSRSVYIDLSAFCTFNALMKILKNHTAHRDVHHELVVEALQNISSTIYLSGENTCKIIFNFFILMYNFKSSEYLTR